MRLSNLADYAVVLMCAAARQCGGRSVLGRRFSAGDLARETGVPLPTVQKLVSRLAGAGLLRSARGSGGGILLARPAAAISLADIVEAVEGPIALTACAQDRRQDCALEASCLVRPHWGAVNEALRAALAVVSLASLSEGPPASLAPTPMRGPGAGAQRPEVSA